MPHSLFKIAGVRVNSYDSLINALSKHKDSLREPVKDVADKMLFKGKGTGSFFLDMAAVPFKKNNSKIKANVAKYVDGTQRKLADMDMKAGAKVHDALSKNDTAKGFRKKVADSFVNTHTINLNESVNGVADRAIKMDVPTLTAPAGKAIKGATGIAGSFALGDLLMKNQNQEVNKMANTRTRQQCIEKIASALNINLAPNNSNELLSKASSALRKAAETQRNLVSEMEKIALEKEFLELKLFEIERKQECEKLANDMLDSGIIKQSEYDNQINDLLIMDAKEFSAIKRTVEKVASSDKIEDEESIGNLQFLACEGIDTSKIGGKSMLEHMSDM